MYAENARREKNNLSYVCILFILSRLLRLLLYYYIILLIFTNGNLF